MIKRADSYTWIRIDKLYIALNQDTYISIHSEELQTCKRIGYEYYCEELFVVKISLNIAVPVHCIFNWIDK